MEIKSRRNRFRSELNWLLLSLCFALQHHRHYAIISKIVFLENTTGLENIKSKWFMGQFTRHYHCRVLVFHVTLHLAKNLLHFHEIEYWNICAKQFCMKNNSQLTFYYSQVGLILTGMWKFCVYAYLISHGCVFLLIKTCISR